MKYSKLCLAAFGVGVLLADPAQAKTLVFCASGGPEGFDPAPFATDATFDAAAQIYDRLIALEPGTTKTVPGLAERWEVSPDGLQYTFHLKAGVKFHATPDFTPTREVNADDVIFSLDRQLEKKNPWFGYAGGIWPFAEGLSLGSRVKDLVRVDDLTVTLVLDRPDAALPADLALDFASILSKEYADNLVAEGRMERLNGQPVGTGPFQVASIGTAGTVTFKANDAYWGGRPKLDDLSFVVLPDPAERLAKLKAGECQVAADLDPAGLAAAKKAGLVLAATEALDISYLAFNTTRKPFDDKRVRKALAMAIDRRAIVDEAYKGDATVARGPLPSTMWAAEPGPADEPYDPEGAKKLLTEAGVAGLKIKLWAMDEPRPYNPDPLRLAGMIAADFAKVGVTVSETVSPPWGEYVRTSAAKDRDGAVLYGWTSDNGDPDNFLGVTLSCDAVGSSNRAVWCDPAFQDLIVRAKAATDPAERARLYGEAQKIVREEAPLVAIAHTKETVAMSGKVSGYVVDPSGRHRFAGVDLAE